MRFVYFLILSLILGLGFRPLTVEAQDNALDLAGLCAHFKEMVGDSTTLYEVPESFNFGYCYGAMYSWLKIYGEQGRFSFVLKINGLEQFFCIPSEVKPQQMAFVFMKFVEEHLERGHESQYDILFDASKEAWPCE